MDTKILLGRRIKELIKRNGISQEKMAELIEIEPASLSNIVTGKNYPLLTTLDKIIKVLNIKYSDVFNFEQHADEEILKDNIIKILNENPDKIRDFYKIAKALTD